ncbi:hypothetical protein [Streptomyces sp. NBC_01803]|uniref:hypothetical protein n=1 Tax=Streptomyces sp. NBC_01803 TaxID=2975946 RepID=UPI002DD8DD7E|nr:hypothetical protein [Streptomyces sp. NBC_01803]WSA46388.1 hypothetical protein OIE51_20675 [Streptomyces sp. NBC_01803]
MYELNRILLRNFGPQDARYENVDLDLSGAGAAVPTASLIPAPGHVSERPSPASLVILQNGGGKGVLMTAIMSTTVPYRHQDVETLRSFVASTAQPSHVILEWSQARTGRLLVTAQTLAPGSDDRLKRLFYSFLPGAALTADSLPFHRDGHWLPFDEFETEIQDLKSRHDALELHSFDTQERWEDHQRGLGLQPELLDVQRRMNQTESGAADAFTTSSADGFVDWLLKTASDDKDYVEVGQLFAAYANVIGQYGTWREEREFARAMQDCCEQVAQAHSKHQTCLTTADAAEHRLIRLAAELLAWSRQLTTDLEQSTEALRTAVNDHTGAQRAMNVAERTVRHVRLAKLNLELDSVTNKHELLREQRRTTQLERDAWRSVPMALRYAAARSAHGSAQTILRDAEQAAAPYLLAADAAAAELRAGYRAAETEARKRVTDLAEASREARDDLSAWRKRAGALREASGLALGEIQTLHTSVQDFEGALEQAQGAGLVQTQETVASAAARAGDQAQHTKQLAEEAKQQLERARKQAAAARAKLLQQEKDAAAARGKADAAEQEIEKLTGEAAAICRQPLTSELLEIDTAHLPRESVLEWLADRITGLDEAARRALTVLSASVTEAAMAVRDDDILLQALDTSDGLLPPAEHVHQLCTLLDERGVIAHPGWQWLRDNVAASEHAMVITTHPELVGGIVVSDAAALDQASQYLQQARPLPTAAVALGTGERMLSTPSTDGHDRIVVEPSPAMHDEEAAAQERRVVEARLAERRAVLEEITSRQQDAQTLVGSTRRWLDSVTEIPVAARLETLRRRVADADAAEATAKETHNHADELDAAVTTMDSEREELLADSAEAQRIADDLGRLATRESAAYTARERIDELKQHNIDRRRAWEELDTKCQQADEDNLARARSIEAAELEASGYARDRDAITASPEADHTQGLQGPPTASLATLRQRHSQGLADLHAVEVGEDLLERARKAERDLSARQQEWGEVAEDVRGRADQLTHDPRANDDVQRDAIRRELDATHTSTDSQLNLLKERSALLKADIESARPPSGACWLDDTAAAAWTPTDLDQAQPLLTAAHDALLAAQETERSAKKARSTAEIAASRASRNIEALKPVLARLDSHTAALDIVPAETAYRGSVEAAEAAAKENISQYAESQRLRSTSQRQLRDAVSELKDKVSDVSYQHLDIPLRKQISALDSTVLPALAADWATGMARRVSALTSDLEGVEKTRETVVSLLVNHVSEALRKLEQASTFSKFPAGTGKWSEQKFLTIRYPRTERTMLANLIRENIEHLAARPKAKSLKGIDIVLRCLHKAVPRGFTVKVLKPTASQRTEYVPVEKMAKVFSGGQELTGAILLYCTLAALRTSPGPRSRTRNGGLLVLDNPIGRANAEYLVDIQLEMAAALGIQLIYTTGLVDHRVMTRFPMHVQLRNDAEARSGLSLVTVSDQVRAALVPAPRISPDPDAPVPTGYLSSARSYTKEDQAG